MITYWSASLVKDQVQVLVLHIFFLLASHSLCQRHVDLWGTSVAAHWALTLLDGDNANCQHLGSACHRADWNVVVCHNVSEEISLSWTLLGGGGEGRERAGGAGQHYQGFEWGGGGGWTAVKEIISGYREVCVDVCPQSCYWCSCLF